MNPPPNVTVYIPGPLREYCAGERELALSAGTVQSVLDVLEHRYPVLYRNVCEETGKVRRHLNLFVNSDHVRDLQGLDTALAQGDVVTILPAVSGG
jgi:MoaD family protein